MKSGRGMDYECMEVDTEEFIEGNRERESEITNSRSVVISLAGLFNKMG